MINKPAKFRPCLDLSTYLDGQEINDYGICFDGSLAVLSRSTASGEVTFWRFESNLVQKLELPFFGRVCGRPQSFADNSVLVTTRRGVSIFSKEGDLLRTLSLNQFSDLQVSASGQIVTCYWDTAVYELGTPALCSVDQEGTVLWSLTPDSKACPIEDCWAMNVCEEAVWATYFDDFPVICVEKNGEITAWKNQFTGVSAIAVEGNRVLLYGGYEGYKNRCVVQTLGPDGLLNEPVLYSLELPVEPEENLVRGRGSDLHLVANSIWYRLRLGDLCHARRANLKR